MAGLLGQRKFSGQFQRADGQGRSRERNSRGRPEIISRLNRGFAARVGHRHARLTWLTAATHLLAALFLFGGKLGVRSDARHDGPAEEDHSQKRHENGATAHKLRLPLPRLGWQDVHATWMPTLEKRFSRFRLKVVPRLTVFVPFGRRRASITRSRCGYETQTAVPIRIRFHG